MANPYDLKAWADQTTRGRQVFNFRYRMRDRDIPGWTLLKVVAMPQAKRAVETVYLWRQNELGDRTLARVSIAELDSWRGAQSRLRETLGDCMRPAIPPGTGKLAQIGDVNLTARDPQSDVAAAVWFVRGNLRVSVASVGEVNIDVSEIAARIDRALAQAPSKAAAVKRRVAVTAPKTVIVRARQRVPLIKALSKSVPANSWLKIIVPDGDISKQDDSLVYVSPEGGKKQIGVYATRTA